MAGRRRSETQHGAPAADVNLASFNVGLKPFTHDKENPPADSRQSKLHRKSVGVAKPCREPSETNRSVPSLVMQTTLVHTRNGLSAKHELGKLTAVLGLLVMLYIPSKPSDSFFQFFPLPSFHPRTLTPLETFPITHDRLHLPQ